MLSRATFLSAIALLTIPTHVDAHGNLYEPKPTFIEGKSTVGWIVMIDNYWDIGSGGDQVGKFKTMAKEKGMSVKDVVLDMVKDQKCGHTRTDVEPQPVPADGKAIWKGNEGGGFTHQGPCELYIDDKMVLHSDNCEDEFPGGDPKSNQMAEMPVDYSSCNGDCMFTIYWLGFQNAGWQAYVNCVPLKGSGSANQTKSGTSDAGSLPEGQAIGASSTETGGSTDEKQSTDANLPAKDSATEIQATEAPSAETKDAGTPTMDSPSTETETKCTAPSRRLRKKATTSIA